MGLKRRSSGKIYSVSFRYHSTQTKVHKPLYVSSTFLSQTTQQNFEKNPKWLFHLNSHVTSDTYWLHYTLVSGISGIRCRRTDMVLGLIFGSSSPPIYGKIKAQLSRRVEGAELVSRHTSRISEENCDGSAF